MAADASPILVVDDDAKIVQLVRTYLEREGFEVITAIDGPAALAAFRDHRPRLGCSTSCSQRSMVWRSRGSSARSRTRRSSCCRLEARQGDRVLGINGGADDHIAKPFSPAELVSRVKAILRRTEGPRVRTHDEPVRSRDLVIDPSRHEVRRGHEDLDLTNAELRLLLALVDADGRILTREALLDALYGGGEGDVMERSVDVYIRRLREKLGDDADRSRYIATVRGAGYRAAPEP